jgi:methylmalonyl-CoA mutase N-terminal domain/subunit
MGGMTEAIETGYVQNEIQKSAYKYEMEIEEKERIIVGVNKYQINEQEHKDLLKINMAVQQEQIKFLNKIRSERNNIEVEKKLAALKTAAQGNDNLIPFIIEAVKEYASIGEICNTLRSVFGEYKEHVVI